MMEIGTTTISKSSEGLLISLTGFYKIKTNAKAIVTIWSFFLFKSLISNLGQEKEF